MSLFDYNETGAADAPSPTPISSFEEGMQVEGYFVVRDASLRDTRKGGKFIRLNLADATGEISANVWDRTEDSYVDITEQYQDITSAPIVKVRGTVESFRDTLQIKLNRLRPAARDEVDLSHLLASSPINPDDMMDELTSYVESMEDSDYSALVHLFIDDAEFIDNFRKAPAARNNHHAYVGGLLEHTVSIMRICDQYARITPALRRDLLIAGAFFHDIGKMEEMSIDVSIEYTDEGSLMGHLMQGVLMIENRLRLLDNFPREKRNLVYHLILSHHGRYEYGSPVLPAIPEALALHHVDNLDAKVYAANRIITEDPGTKNWTERSWMLETRLFKG